MPFAFTIAIRMRAPHTFTNGVVFELDVLRPPDSHPSEATTAVHHLFAKWAQTTDTSRWMTLTQSLVEYFYGEIWPHVKTSTQLAPRALRIVVRVPPSMSVAAVHRFDDGAIRQRVLARLPPYAFPCKLEISLDNTSPMTDADGGRLSKRPRYNADVTTTATSVTVSYHVGIHRQSQAGAADMDTDATGT